MALRTYELHPAVVHAPLALLPTAAVMDLLACSSPRRRRLDRTGLALWWATAGSALVAGLSGMAASQEIEPRTDRARDVMFLHGIGNAGLVVAALGLAVYRTRHRASLTSAVAGLDVNPSKWAPSRASRASCSCPSRTPGSGTAAGGTGVVLRFALFMAPDAAHTKNFLSAACAGEFKLAGDLDAYVSFIHIDDAAAAARLAPAAFRAFAAAAGVYLIYRGGWPIAIIGIVSIVCGILYTAGPVALGYIGVADLFVLVFFGPVALAGTYYAQALEASEA